MAFKSNYLESLYEEVQDKIKNFDKSKGYKEIDDIKEAVNNKLDTVEDTTINQICNISIIIDNINTKLDNPQILNIINKLKEAEKDLSIEKIV